MDQRVAIEGYRIQGEDVAFRSFNVGPAKGLRRAAGDNVPMLMVITGPNGAGKSTLLHQLYTQRIALAEPGTDVIYMGPHRPWRKATLSSGAMFQMPYTYGQYLGMETFPGWQQFAPPGLQYLGHQPRHPDTADETQSLVKYSMAKLGFRRLRLLQETYEQQGGQTTQGSLPDIFEPLRGLTRYLLPHLEFERIDLTNDQDIKVLFRRIDGDEVDFIDLDDLSSGEKAVVALFFPFLEFQVERLLSVDAPVERLALPSALIDEPEIHLHPTLQVSLVDYLRQLAQNGEAQFIITTHSPTIIDSLSDDELFLLVPIVSAVDGNQLVRVTASEERLEAIRGLTGATHLVTRCRPIIFLEGDRPSSAKNITDQRLVELLIPEAASWVLVAATSRTEAIKSAVKLRDAAADGLPGVAVFALVDADQGTTDDPDFAISWPVAMVENLLLDAPALWELLTPHREQTKFANIGAIDTELRAIARELREDEIRLRIGSATKLLRAELKTIEGISAEEAIVAATNRVLGDLAKAWNPEALAEELERAQTEVDRILVEGRELEAFRGKEILRIFYDRHLKAIFPGRQAFVYALAQEVRRLPRLRQLVAVPVRRIQQYVPADLVQLLEDACARFSEGEELVTAIEALRQARAARQAWECNGAVGQPLDGSLDVDVDRNKLREQLVQIARAVRNLGLVDMERALLAAAVQVGLG
jgi:ABC-type multidrug transport system ATPase subunit